MTVSQTWTEPSAYDLGDNDIVPETHYDGILSDLLYLGRIVEISLTNKSGGALAIGDVVIVDSANDNAVTTTTTASLTGIKGVARAAIANNAAGRIAMAGAVTVATTGTVNRGDYLETSAVAGKARSAGTAPTGKTFARALTASSGGSCTALLLPAAAEVAGETTGVIKAYGGSSAPSGYLLCDGSAVSRTTYADLFAVVSTAFGTGDGSTTFNLPDLRGRLPLGKDNMGGVSADRVTATEADNIGQGSGAETHTLTIAEMPAHSHNRPIQSGGGAGNTLRTDSVESGAIASTSTGGGGAHNNVQPYQTVNYIIKT